MFDAIVSPNNDDNRNTEFLQDREVTLRSHCTPAVKKLKVADVDDRVSFNDKSSINDAADTDVEIVETELLSEPSPCSSNINCSPDDVQIIKSNLVNALNVYTHPRFLCATYPFTADNDAHENQMHCPKCFCYKCQIEAGKCKSWLTHCHTHDGTLQKVDDLHTDETSATVEVINVDEGEDENDEFRIHRGIDEYEDEDEFFSVLSGDKEDYTRYSVPGYYANKYKHNERPAREIKITEVLGKNLELLALDTSNDSPTKISTLKMEGDIPQLNLTDDIYIEGVRVGWPFPEIMRPQRQIAIHLIKALKARRHVILESPTGTGKSAAILCAVLGWHRWYKKFGNTLDKSYVNDLTELVYDDDLEEKTSFATVPRIFYCSRTHSQVAQMVSSLRKTPYRPKMAILGSRDRMCIHKKLRPQDGSEIPAKKINFSNECRLRVRNVESFRKKAKSYKDGSFYKDDDPPPFMSSDELLVPQKSGSATNTTEENYATQDASHPEYFGEIGDEEGNEDGAEQISQPSSKSPTCPHYRSLTSKSIATLAYKNFFPNTKTVNCCSNGGEQSNMGLHDIEDLVSFGVTPQVLRNIAIYRSQDRNDENSGESFGILLKNGFRQGKKVVVVEGLESGGAAEREGTLTAGDVLLSVNKTTVVGLVLNQVLALIRKAERVLLLDVVSSSGDIPQDDKVRYSSHSPCPYYLSQALAAKADLVFAPYNYILDPAIRKAMGINLANSVVILDEAHNIEDILRESGSGKFTEIELCEMIILLSKYANKEKDGRNMIEISHPKAKDGKMHVADVAHPILVFIERLIQHLITTKKVFMNNPGKNGANYALQEWRRFRTPDDHEFEVDFYGPNGKKVGTPDGCQSFFDQLEITPAYLDSIELYTNAFEKYFKGNDSIDASIWNPNRTNVDRIVDFISVFVKAKRHYEHYMISFVVTANGSLSFAADEGDHEPNRPWTRPKTIPLIFPNSDKTKNCSPLPFCRHRSCKVIHGSYCDGSTPRWETAIVVRLLTPGILMKEISNNCRTLVLASGTLSPIQSLAAELDLQSLGDPSKPFLFNNGLQVRPPPLEAEHIINLSKQLLAVSIGHFPDGSPLTVTSVNYQKRDWLRQFGNALCNVIECVPNGGVLVFLPSYLLLKKCVDEWNPIQQTSQHKSQSVWQRLRRSKGKVIVEQTGSQEAFEAAKVEYNETIRTQGSCILLAVYRGKMSEGVSFNDDFARCVICVGLPLPNWFDRAITAKRAYNDEQRLLRKRTDLLPGNEWYKQQAYRALAQALGRCIRHSTDYGTVILMDSRHCHDDFMPLRDGVCQAHVNLPKWMRSHVRNLARVPLTRNHFMHDQPTDTYPSSIPGGWLGLKAEMLRFFREAVIYCAEVEEKQRLDFRKAQENRAKEDVLQFNQRTGCWNSRNQDTLQSVETKSLSEIMLKAESITDCTS